MGFVEADDDVVGVLGLFDGVDDDVVAVNFGEGQGRHDRAFSGGGDVSEEGDVEFVGAAGGLGGAPIAGVGE